MRLTFACCAVALLGCGPSEPANAPAPIGWGYEGELGPMHWGTIDPSFATCDRGRIQSPLDLPAHPGTATLHAPTIHWDPIPALVRNTGHTVEVDDTAPSSLVFDGKTYTLTNFHFHVPAEHTVDGRRFDGEMHFVHEAESGEKLVVALLIERGQQNELFRALLDAMPAVVRPAPIDAGYRVDVASLLPASPSWYFYEGSLTAPPCTEGVKWLILPPDHEHPLQMSDAQLVRLRAAMHGPSARPIQPPNGRFPIQLLP